jgi:hypothetical protein
MKTHLLFAKLLVCLLFALPTFGQKPHVVDLDPEMIDLPNRGFYIAQVIDQRPMKDNIGVVQKGLANRQTSAVMRGDLVTVWQNYFDKSLPKTSAELVPITLIINNFLISEKTYMMKEVGKAELTVSFYREATIERQKLLTNSAEETNNGMDVTGGHSKRIKAVILKCLTDFNQQFQQLIAQTPELLGKNNEIQDGLIIESNSPSPLSNPDAQEVAPSTNLDTENHILTCTKRKIGIYKNFQELVSNSPSITTTFELTRQGGDFVMLRDGQTGKKIKDAFGFYDGNTFYINTFNYSPKKTYARVVAEGRYFAWIDNYVSPATAGVAGGGGFGLLGAALVASDLDCVFLDLKTGVVKVAKKESMDQVLSEDQELWQKYQQSNSKRNYATQLEFILEFNKRNLWR